MQRENRGQILKEKFKLQQDFQSNQKPKFQQVEQNLYPLAQLHSKN